MKSNSFAMQCNPIFEAACKKSPHFVRRHQTKLTILFQKVTVGGVNERRMKEKNETKKIEFRAKFYKYDPKFGEKPHCWTHTQGAKVS